MAQKPLLMKSSERISQTEIRYVAYKTLQKPDGFVGIDGIGKIAVMKSVGVDRSGFQVSTTSGYMNVDAKPDAIKKKLRRLRQQEAEQLEKLDQQIYILKLQREALLKEAWQKGNVVTVKELKEQAEQREEQIRKEKAKE